MATITPPATTPASPQNHGKSTHVAIADTYPPIIKKQSIGSVIEAKVLEIKNFGSLEIQTKFGDFIISSELSYSKGEKFLLQLLKFSPKPTFLIRKILDDDIKREVDTSKNGANSISKRSPSITNLSSDLKRNTNIVPQEIRSTTQSQDSTKFLPNPTDLKFRIGEVVQAKLLEIKPGGSKGAGNHLSENIVEESLKNFQLGNLKGQEIINTPHTVKPPSKYDQKMKNLMGSEIVLRIFSKKLNIPEANTSSLDQGVIGEQVLQAHVLGMSNEGALILKTPVGHFILNSPPQANLDKTISLEFIYRPQSRYTPFASESTINSIIEHQNWPALNETLELTRSLGSSGHQLIFDVPLPRIGNQLAANILFFISALRGGDLRSWLGNDAARQLQESHPNLYSRLNEEFNQLARPLSEANTNDWRSAIIPLLNGAQLEYVKMHFRGESNQHNQIDDGDATRFIIDLDLSKLGRIQLDGLITSKGKHFDLFVRSEVPLEKSMRRDLNNIFIEFMEITGISGKIVIRSNLPFIDVSSPYSPPNDGVGVIV